MTFEILNMQQGCAEWHDLRKTKITATDCPIIMGESHWKTRVQLYHEKISDEYNHFISDRMQRGIDLEPIARDLFNIQTGFLLIPRVVINDWAMASLDGMSEDGKTILEIKCPGQQDHELALDGKVPKHYYGQLQHQMYVCNVQNMYYFSFDGTDGVTVIVKRDDHYIDRMIVEEKKFYECIIKKITPEPQENDYIEREDDLWKQCALQWMSINNSLKELEKKEQEIRNQLIFLSGESNTKGAGISLCHVKRKGNVDYQSMIKKLHVSEDIIKEFRKPEINSWRLTSL